MARVRKCDWLMIEASSLIAPAISMLPFSNLDVYISNICRRTREMWRGECPDVSGL